MVATLSTTELADVSGGDAGSGCTSGIKQDWKDFTGRAKATGDDLQKHHYASAAGNFGNELVDEVKLATDAVKPVSPDRGRSPGPPLGRRRAALRRHDDQRGQDRLGRAPAGQGLHRTRQEVAALAVTLGA